MSKADIQQSIGNFQGDPIENRQLSNGKLQTKQQKCIKFLPSRPRSGASEPKTYFKSFSIKALVAFIPSSSDISVPSNSIPILPLKPASFTIFMIRA